MPIRIRFERTHYPHWGERSGYIQFVRQLDPRRYQVTVHAASDSDADFARWLIPFRPWIRRAIQRGGMPWYKLSDFSAEIEALKGCMARRFDIVHFLDGEHSGQFLPRLIKATRLSSVRTIATFHQPPEVACKVVNGELLRWLDEIVLVSPSQLPFFKQYVPEDRLHVLLHGIDADFFRPAPTPNRTDRIRCITAGHWLRDWNVFRSVARAMNGIAFDVVTDRKIDVDGLANVSTYGGVGDSRLVELYQSADILFLPLVQSTANNTLLEGIASGLPVVATDLEAIRTYLPRDEGILVADNSVDAFVDALRRLQQDVGLRHAMGLRARARAEELAWPRLVGQYETLYMGASRASRRRSAHG